MEGMFSGLGGHGALIGSNPISLETVTGKRGSEVFLREFPCTCVSNVMVSARKESA